MAKKLALEVQNTITSEGQLFDFRRPDTPPILLILDRRNDPVTPLLTQWTYQAMVHELIGIHHGRVDMTNVPEVKNELKVSYAERGKQRPIYSVIIRKLSCLLIKIHSSKSQCTSTWEI